MLRNAKGVNNKVMLFLSKLVVSRNVSGRNTKTMAQHWCEGKVVVKSVFS